MQKTSSSDQDKLRSAAELGLMVIDIDSAGEEDWPEDEANETDDTESEKHMDRAIEILSAAIPYPYDYFTRPDNPPNNPRRFSIEPWGGGTEYLIADSHTLDEHVISRKQLEDPDFDLVSWLIMEKHEIKDNLYDGILRERPMPEAWRAAMEGLEWFPVIRETDRKEIVTQLRDDLLMGIPYSFDSDEDADFPKVHSPDRFEVEWEDQTLLWVTDHTTESKYSLKTNEIVDDDFTPNLWLENAYLRMRLRREGRVG